MKQSREERGRGGAGTKRKTGARALILVAGGHHRIVVRIREPLSDLATPLSAGRNDRTLAEERTRGKKRRKKEREEGRRRETRRRCAERQGRNVDVVVVVVVVDVVVVIVVVVVVVIVDRRYP